MGTTLQEQIIRKKAELWDVGHQIRQLAQIEQTKLSELQKLFDATIALEKAEKEQGE